ncbi:CHASE2 domain-containing sensor protein [Caldalkalibacillus uzonensis]|uniref:CHASE2 domain-containing sensor protein n=1 Tax=Caldalkalibacillus uzonensis TaxID=353224 RepID=A0ABU0CSQ2_9BACI|nr:hypothetical protein [Caldalkalibacillus uzonensis]MDQ0338926.1 CHASE2 domain-containing sensor protein [Caldalkalibacillus uzonensis]
MKENISNVLLELGLSLVGLCLAFVGVVVKNVRRLKEMTSTHWFIGLAGLSVFLIGFGLLSLLGTEPFAVPVIIAGIVGLVLSTAKLVFIFLQIGLILATSSINHSK